MAAPGPHAQDVAFEARLPELRAGGAVDGVAREAIFRDASTPWGRFKYT